jgi:putative phosphoribosyl transferase
MPFRDRADAGRTLAARLARQRGTDAVVVALPRGGVPVTVEIARALGLPLDFVVVRKLGLPEQPEVAMGAVAEGGAFFIDHHMIAESGATAAEIGRVWADEVAELERRVHRWRRRPAMSLAGKTAIVVDDGIATGGTVRAAVRAVRKRGARRIVLAVPIAPVSTLEALADTADDIVCLEPVESLGCVGAWYEDFRQVGDEEVTALLARSGASGAERSRTRPRADWLA